MLRKISALFILIVVTTIVFAPDLRAQNLVGRATRGMVGVKLGFISNGMIREEQSHWTELGMSGGVYGDLPIGGGFYIPVSFDFHSFRLAKNWEVMLDVGVGLKATYKIQRTNVEIKPGVAIGVANLPQLGVVETSNYITTKLMLEVHFPINKRHSWVGEIALFGAPVGRNNEYDVTIGPILIVRVGLAFR